MNMKNRNSIYPLILLYLLLVFTSNCSKSDIDGEDKPISGKTVTDIDGNVYHTVVIGKQIWMVENLKVLHYNDGTTPIPIVTDPLDWQIRTDAACCMYNNDNTNFATYGVLYNWYAASNNKLCPKGWHVATNDEWIIMNDWLNDKDTGGGKLKESGTTHWSSPNTGADNSSGFTALPGGQRHADFGSFNYIGLGGYTWSSTGSNVNSDNAWSGWVSYDKSYVKFASVSKRYGFSVRCIKDK
jgi:uncharacterized protein (TIGR02145 family)